MTAPTPQEVAASLPPLTDAQVQKIAALLLSVPARPTNDEEVRS